MSALAQATQLAASSASQQPVSNGMLMAEFVVVSIVAAGYTMFKARKSKDRSPVKLGLACGIVVGLLAVGLTMVLGGGMSFFG